MPFPSHILVHIHMCVMHQMFISFDNLMHDNEEARAYLVHQSVLCNRCTGFQRFMIKVSIVYVDKIYAHLLEKKKDIILWLLWPRSKASESD
jgi:hypothetical protein